KNDMDYALQFKQSVEIMNWKECYENGYFSTYTGLTSLKRAFYKKKKKKRPNEEK
ncbi:uncharacterized protein BX663DRAFT_425639, partial [Cokeromyces recurvatus]|uniref:uncharacterized protein n=1 Tax=Cokeromyces recurvatus TaxID=90255 RepID=UPI00221E55D5